MKKQYNALRIIGTIYKVLGVISGVITILLVFSLCLTSILGGAAMDSVRSKLGSSGLPALFSGFLGGLLLSVIAIIYGGGISITLYAIGEGVYLLLALEENTRATAMLLQQQKQ